MTDWPINIVLDTSVLVAASRSRRGASAELLRRLAERPSLLAVHLSVPLVLEYEHALREQTHPDAWKSPEIDNLLDFLCATARPHEVFYLWRPMLKDPDDEFVLELAFVAGVNYIVTHNVSDFTGAASLGIGIITPGDLLKTLRETR